MSGTGKQISRFPAPPDTRPATPPPPIPPRSSRRTSNASSTPSSSTASRPLIDEDAPALPQNPHSQSSATAEQLELQNLIRDTLAAAAVAEAEDTRPPKSNPETKIQDHTYEKGCNLTKAGIKVWEPSHIQRGSQASETTAVTGTTLRGDSERGTSPHRTSKELRNDDTLAKSDRVLCAQVQLQQEQKVDSGVVYPKCLALSFLTLGISLSVFLISLDRTIITTAIPFITNEFESYDDIGWYGSAYLVTASAFQPLYGRIFTTFNMKWAYLTAVTLFEIGSLICGVAPTSNSLIIGRAVAGLGSAGILTGSFVVIAHAVPLSQRPILSAAVGLVFGAGATVGPLLGGAFTDMVTWRWCFYFNLPVGGTTVAAMLFFFHPPKDSAIGKRPFFQRVKELDITGNTLLLGAAVQLFLALQLTEQNVPWKSAKVIGLLAGSGATFILFCVWQWRKADDALMPPRILGQRSVAAACGVAFFIYSAILIHGFYLPIWFQAIKNTTAFQSGVNMVPYIVANAALSLAAGVFVSKNGYFAVPAILGSAIGTVGCGLLSTLNEKSSIAQWAGYQILASFGIGMAIQQGFIAVQIALPLGEVPIGTAAVVAFQSLGGAIFVSVGNNILQNWLIEAGKQGKLPGVDIQAVIDAGAGAFRQHVSKEHLPALVNVYNEALQRVLIVAVPVMGLAMISAIFFEWREINDTKNNGDDTEIAKHTRPRRETDTTMVDATSKSPTRQPTLTFGRRSFSHPLP